MFSLKDKVVVITGGSNGIGRGIAEKFVEAGAKVVISDIQDAPKELTEKLGDSAIFVKCNVANSKEVDNLVDQAIKKFGKINIMVNNAGVGVMGNAWDTTDEGWKKVIDINLSGVFYGIRKASSWMKDNKVEGCIINMSSILGNVGMQGTVSYCASKGGVVQLTRAAALDLAPFKIRVNAIAPGFIETNMTKDFLSDENFKNMVITSTPLGFVGKPDDIANAALYLAADESRYVTGHVLLVDGGWTAK